MYLRSSEKETEWNRIHSGPFHCGLIPCEQLVQEHGTLPSGEKCIVALLSSQKVRVHNLQRAYPCANTATLAFVLPLGGRGWWRISHEIIFGNIVITNTNI